jgi:hypothetical protein
MAHVSLRPCLEIEDQTKERLDCYDAKIKPAPKKTSVAAKSGDECRFILEEDARLGLRRAAQVDGAPCKIPIKPLDIRKAFSTMRAKPVNWASWPPRL